MSLGASNVRTVSPEELSNSWQISFVSRQGTGYKLDEISIKKDLEEAYRKTDTAQEFIGEILRIWSEAGFIKGEWSCKMPQDKGL